MSSDNSYDAPERGPSALVKACFLIWAAGILFLYWLVHGPYGPLMTNRFVDFGRGLMLRYFTARYIFNN